VTGSPAWKIVSAGAVSWLMASQRSSGCPLATMRLDAGPRPEVLGAASCLLACMDFESLIIRDGDRVAASGRLVRDSRGDWFQPSLPVALPGGVERTVRPAGRLAIRVVGADLDLVANRFEKAGAIEGWAAVEGVRSGEQLEVDRQSLPSPEPPWSHPWRTPPCPPPAGSWPKVTPWFAPASLEAAMSANCLLAYQIPAPYSRFPHTLSAAYHRSTSEAAPRYTMTPSPS